MAGDGSRDAAGRAFSFARRDDGTVVISYGAAPVTALRGRAAERFVARVARAADDSTAQQLMARATERVRGHGEHRA